VADLLRSRLDVLDGATLQAVQAAAVIGRSFDPETLGAVAGRTSEEVVGALEALAGQELIREVAGEAAARPHYDFSHEKLRELVYQDTSLARRRLLHGRAARAAEQPRPARSQGAAAGPIARHYRLAGQDAEAAAWYAVAGDHARSLYANAEALGLYADALASGHPDTCRLSEAIADVQTLLGDYGAALRAYEAAAALCEPGSATLARVEHRLGLVHSRRGDWQAAGSHFEAALACLAGTGDAAPPDGSAGRILADWSLAAHALGQPDRASELARDALVAAGAANDRAGVAQAHNILGILARGGGDHRGAMAQLRRSLDIAETLQDPGIRIAALNNLALALADGEEHEEALAAAREALELCVAVGDRHREAAQHNNLADLLHAAGREEEAMAHLKQAVVIFAQVGGAGEIAQPEVWKLSEW
jgi:tetratricopeptide (TPR) repeat protein